MAYVQILKALQQTAAQKCVLVHTHRTLSTASRMTFLRRVEAPSSLLPAASSFIQAQRRRNISLDFRAWNKSNPEERDKSVSRYQSGSPQPSAAQKGTDTDELWHV